MKYVTGILLFFMLSSMNHDSVKPCKIEFVFSESMSDTRFILSMNEILYVKNDSNASCVIRIDKASAKALKAMDFSEIYSFPEGKSFYGGVQIKLNDSIIMTAGFMDEVSSNMPDLHIYIDQGHLPLTSNQIFFKTNKSSARFKHAKNIFGDDIMSCLARAGKLKS